MSHDIEQHTPSPSPTRRTVLTGAAWSVPVIAAASLAPFATASGTLALAFNQASYSGTACGTLTIVVTATTNAVATAGASVTIALSNGYTFSGGGTTYSGVTDSAGQVVGIPAINVPAAGGTTTFTAVSGAATANATATATASLGSAFLLDAYGNVSAKPNVPTGSKPIGYLYYLTAGGNLVDSDGNVIATNVAEVGTPVSYGTGGIFFVPFTKQDGSAFLIDANRNVTARTGVPTGSKPIGYLYYLTTGGNLVDADGNVIATNVAEVGTPVGYGAGGIFYVPFTKKDGSAFMLDAYGTVTAKTNVPSGSKPIGYRYYLTAGGNLIDADGDVVNVVATNVGEVGTPVSYGSHNVFFFPFLKKDGSAFLLDANGTVTAETNVPTGSKPIGYYYYLTQGGNLIDAAGNVIATNVAETGTPVGYGSGAVFFFPFTKKAASC